MHLEGRGQAAQALRTDAGLVDHFQQFPFKGRVARVRVDAFQIARGGFLSADGRHFHGAAQAHAHHQGRTGIGTGGQHRVQHHPAHALDAVGGHQHFQHAFVFRARALGREAQAQAVAGHNARMDNGGGVVPGVLALEERFSHAGFAQIAVHIAPAHAFVDGVLKAAAHNAHILPHLGENHGQARILADGHGFARRDGRVFQDLVQNVPAHRRRLQGAGRPHGLNHVLGQAAAGFHGQTGHGLRNGSNVNFLHILSPPERLTDGKARSWE